jgi:O-antigen/teichoic acid export membrane protein
MSPVRTEAFAQRPDAMLPADRSSVAHNATWLTGAMLAARASTFALAIFMGRDLGVSAYGLYGFAVAVGTIVVPLADLGVTPYVSREVARDRARGEERSVHLLRVKTRMALAALAMSVAAAALLSSQPSNAAAVVVVLASMLADGVSAFAYGYFQGREQMGFEARATALAALARGSGGIVCVLAFGALLPVLAWMLAVSAIQLAVALRRFTATVDLARVRRAAATARVSWRRVGALGSTTLFALVYLQADSVIIGVVYDKYEVGLYTAAYALTAGLQIIPWQVAVALAPAFARSHVSDPAGFRETWHRGLRLVLMISLPFALVTCLLAGEVMNLIFGPSFAGGATALAILVWSSPVWATNMVVAGALRGARRDGWLAMTTGLGVVLNLSLNVWAIPTFGIDGAAAVTVGTELAVLIVQGWLVLRARIAPIPRLPYVRLALALLALGAVALATAEVEVILAAIVALCAYAATLLATGAVPRSELRALRSLASRTR